MRWITGLQSLVEWRATLCLRFAKSCIKNDKKKHMFPQNFNINTRNVERYQVTHGNTERLKTSAIPYMQRLLNNEL